MRTFLVVDTNYVDQFIQQQILRAYGTDAIEIFNSMPKAWDFLKNNHSPKTIVLADVKVIMYEDGHTLVKPKEYLGELEIYVLYVMLTEADKNRLSNYDSIKGLIEKPFTLDKLKQILED